MTEIELDKNATRRLKPGHYLVRSGCLWLTVDGRDLIFKAGESCQLSRTSLAQALEVTRLSLVRPPQALARLSLDAG